MSNQINTEVVETTSELSQEEINELMNEPIEKIIEKLLQVFQKSIIDMKPSEFNFVQDEKTRKELLNKYNLVSKIYLDPYKKRYDALMNRVNKNAKVTYISDLGDLSIAESLKAYKKMLKPFGYTNEQLRSLVPQSAEDLAVMTQAFEGGYYDRTFMDNAQRIVAARNYNSREQAAPRM